MEKNSCKKCNHLVEGNYCSNCGQPKTLRKIDRSYIIGEIADTLFAHKGFFYTTKRMLLHPGDSVRYYITEDRSRYVKPVTFLIITSLIYTIVIHFCHISAKDFYFQQPDVENSTMTLFVNWMTDYHGYSSIIIGLFMASWVKLLFRRFGYNLFEIFILLCFISGIVSLFSSFGLILQSLIHLNLIHALMVIAMIYTSWAIGQFFDKQQVASYIRAFLSYLLGISTFSILLAFIATFIEMVIKH